MTIKTQLQELFERHEVDVGAYAWMHENDRWAELIFCLLNQYNPQNAQTIRMAVSSLQYLGLLDTTKLSLLETPGNEDVVVFAHILKRHGFSPENTEHAVKLLVHVASVIHKDYEGKIQRYLRRAGERMRDELANMFGGGLLKEEQLHYAISSWLQNALSLPISLEHPAVLEFCKRNGVSVEELLHAADELDLNIALVDDLLELDRRIKETTSEHETVEEGAS